MPLMEILALMQNAQIFVGLVLLSVIVYRGRRRAVLIQHQAQGEAAGSVTVLKDGLFYCERPYGHVDLKEFLETPGFSVRHPDGTIEQGVQ